MKKILIITILIGLIAILAGCSSMSIEKNNDTSQNEDIVTKKPQKDNATSKSKAKSETDEKTTSKSNDAAVVFSDKKDIELLKLLGATLEPYDNVYTKAVIKMKVPDYGEIIVKQINYKQADSYYIESQNSMMGDKVHISIFDAETRYNYEYVKGETTGNKYMISDNFTKFDSLSDMGVELDDVIDEDDYGNLVTAQIEKLDGDDVVYIESKEAMDEIGLATNKMWFSIKYHHPLKWLIIAEDGSEYSSYIVEEIEVDKDFSSHITIPNDVEFTEY